jgi:hypothetical protein
MTYMIGLAASRAEVVQYSDRPCAVHSSSLRTADIDEPPPLSENSSAFESVLLTRQKIAGMKIEVIL